MRSLLWFLPDSMMPVLVVVLAIGLIVGIIKPRALWLLLSTILVILLAGPFVESLFAGLPGLVSLAVLAVLGWVLFRWMISAVLGEEAAGHVIGTFAVRALSGLVRLIFLPFRLVFWFTGALLRRLVGGV